MAAQYLQVDKQNISDHYFKIAESIRQADFIALDTEFAGLKLPHQFFSDVCQWSSTQAIYSSYTLVCEQFKLLQLLYGLQLGVSTFKWDEATKKYREELFSFFMHPKGETSVATDSDTLAFLSRNQFDFQRSYSKGLPSCQLETVVSRERWEELLAADDPYRLLMEIVDNTEAVDKRLSQLEGKKVHAKRVVQQALEVRASVEKWVATTVKELKIPIFKGTWDYLNENRWTDFVKKLSVSAGLKKKDGEYTIELKRKTESKKDTQDSSESSEMSDKMSQEEGSNNSVLSTADQLAANTRMQDLLQNSGVALLILEIIRHRKPIVAHCSLYDLMYIYQNFLGQLVKISIYCYYRQLPTEVDNFLQAWNHCFPSLYDTKLLTTTARETEPHLKPNLGSAYDRFSKSGVFDGLFTRATFEQKQLHDAGYDASICGVVMVCTALLVGVIKAPLTENTKPITDGAEPASIFEILAPYKNKIYSVNPTRIIDISFISMCTIDIHNRPASEPTGTDRVLCMKWSSAIDGAEEKTQISFLTELSDLISEEYTFQFHKINKSNYYVELKDCEPKDIAPLVDKLNKHFEGKCAFSTYDKPLIEASDRFWYSRLGYV